jgi:hypothetical protein
MQSEIVEWLFWVIYLLGIVGYALWLGGLPERLVAGADLLAWLATLLVQDRRDWFHPQWGILAVDVVLLGFLVWLALTRDRGWLLFATAFQLLVVVTHLAIFADPGVRSLVYLRSLTIWSYLGLAALAIGARLAARRRAQPA